MNSDDREGLRREAKDIAAEVFTTKNKPKTQDAVPHHVAVRKAARDITMRVHAKLSPIAAAGGDADPGALTDLCFKLFWEEFERWSKDDLLFLTIMTHSFMELEDLGVPVTLQSKIIKPYET
jgi:hypothetical protein